MRRPKYCSPTAPAVVGRFTYKVPEPEREIRVLSEEKIQRLVDAAPSVRWKALISVGVTTGMRRGEMFALRWKDVDLDEGMVWVSPPLTGPKAAKTGPLGFALRYVIISVASPVMVPTFSTRRTETR